MDEGLRNYFKLNEPDTKGHILYLYKLPEFCLYKLPGIGKLIETENRLEEIRDCEEGEWEVIA